MIARGHNSSGNIRKLTGTNLNRNSSSGKIEELYEPKMRTTTKGGNDKVLSIRIITPQPHNSTTYSCTGAIVLFPLTAVR